MEQLNQYAGERARELRISVRCESTGLSMDIVKRAGGRGIYRAKNVPLADIADIAAARKIIDRFVEEARCA